MYVCTGDPGRCRWQFIAAGVMPVGLPRPPGTLVASVAQLQTEEDAWSCSLLGKDKLAGQLGD